MKLLSSDFFVVSISAVIITSFSFIYYKDITTKVEAGNLEQVGILSFKRKTAQRKYTNQVVWEDLDQDVPVYNNDSIRTAEMSEATVRLSDGTEIKLNENSMILLALSKNQISIEFARGSMQALRGDIDGEVRKLNIKSAKTSVSIDKGDIKLSQGKKNDLSLSVKKGNASIDTGKGKKEINKDERVVVAKDSRDVMMFKLTIKLKSPGQNSCHLTTKKEKKIKFTWEKIKGDHIVFFEIAKDNSFENIVIKKKALRNYHFIYLKKGVYYWRVMAVNRVTKKVELSDSRRLTVIFDDPINLLSPNDNDALSYRTIFPVVNFKWTKSEIALRYRLALARDPSMKDVIKSFNVKKNKLVLNSLGKGIYYWRIEKVTGLEGINNARSSDIYKLTVNKKDIIAPPELIYPGNKKRFSKIVLEKQDIIFTWRNNPEIRESKFLLAKDKQFKDIIFSGISKVNFFKFKKDLPKGKYYWRAMGTFEDGENTAPSIGRVFSIIDTVEMNLIRPLHNAVLTPEEDERYASARFSWKRSDIKGKYKLLVSKEDSFKTIYKETKVAYYTTRLKVRDIESGKYFWKVMLVDIDDAVLAQSKTRSIIVKDRLERPIVLSPQDGYVINMRDKNILSLNWKKVDGANLYKVTLYQKGKKKERQIAEIKLTTSNCKITDLRKLDIGKFFWTLQAYETGGGKKGIIRKTPVVRSNFSINLGKAMEKADVNSLKIDSL